jgi:hypothetical protein
METCVEYFCSGDFIVTIDPAGKLVRSSEPNFELKVRPLVYWIVLSTPVIAPEWSLAETTAYLPLLVGPR